MKKLRRLPLQWPRQSALKRAMHTAALNSNMSFFSPCAGRSTFQPSEARDHSMPALSQHTHGASALPRSFWDKSVINIMKGKN